MQLTKRNKNLKFIFIVLQLIVMTFFFVAMADSQTIMIIKEIVQNFGFGSNFQSFLAKVYLVSNMFAEIPSFVTVLFILVNILCISTAFKPFANYHCFKRFFGLLKKIPTPEENFEIPVSIKPQYYMEKQRMLN